MKQFFTTEDFAFWSMSTKLAGIANSKIQNLLTDLETLLEQQKTWQEREAYLTDAVCEARKIFHYLTSTDIVPVGDMDRWLKKFGEKKC